MQLGEQPALETGTDEHYMRLALAAAREGGAAGEVPIGALVVRDGIVLSAAHNAPIALHDPTAHAEMLAVRWAAERVSNYRLCGATVFVTVEPCVMCVGALLHARVARVVFGCREPKGGALGSSSDVAAEARSTRRLAVTAGVCATEARDLLQEFFRLRRGA